MAKNVTLWAVRAMDCQGNAKVSAILDVRTGRARIEEEGRAAWCCSKGSREPANRVRLAMASQAAWPARCPIMCSASFCTIAADCSFRHCTFLQAFEWIADNAIAPAVVSMSVAGNISPAVNEAARRLVEVGSSAPAQRRPHSQPTPYPVLFEWPICHHCTMLRAMPARHLAL